jgi:hypothetical protein
MGRHGEEDVAQARPPPRRGLHDDGVVVGGADGGGAQPRRRGPRARQQAVLVSVAGERISANSVQVRPRLHRAAPSLAIGARLPL